MDGQAVPSVMQLSTFTKVTSIPREKSYREFPVMVRVKAPEMTVHQHSPVDIVAVIDVSWSMGWDDKYGKEPNDRLILVKKAMAKVIKNLAGAQNRLAVVAFDHEIKKSTELLEMNDKGQQSALETVNGLTPFGRTTFSIGLKEAAKILDKRAAREKDRLAFIIFLSDGDDPEFTKEDIPPAYPIHAFGFSADHDPKALQDMANLTMGSYTPINKDLEKITEKLDQLSEKLVSIVAVNTVIHLKTMHSGVFLSKIESSSANDAVVSYKSRLADGKQSGEIIVGDVSSGKEMEFTVYLDVPECQGNCTDGAMELLTVGGVYKQSWDQKQVELSKSVVTVERPASCKELDWIEQRVEYWCKVKLDLSAMYDKVCGGNGDESNCQCQDLQALRETSLEAINQAMRNDIYTATLHAIKLRHCGGAVAAETEKSPLEPVQPAKAV
ncbi:hypothetical protein SEVIR_7G029900v4 [Setaria viridis]|uniref:VWFA domain-containing protein n=1 Tax=Setaria viridis TaxID=4556 RepID=A0A4U6TQJ6_SETVI|nr:uncharacterized protein LOC117863091 [Setaria viridis]TKW02929.1 hypothetical protein SEVIR_7G029900v2 [Setaria viridis]